MSYVKFTKHPKPYGVVTLVYYMFASMTEAIYSTKQCIFFSNFK